VSQGPIIGITVEGRRSDDPRTGGKLELNWNYPQAVAEAGGVPILLPPTTDPAAVASILDGLLVPGGLDIDASEFGEENHPEAELQDPTRFAFEKALYRAMSPEAPVLGICYGCQFLNVVEGGTLQQHLPDELGHNEHSGGRLERLELEPGSKVALATGASRVEGKSYHHQAIARAGGDVRVVGRGEDGVIEAIEVASREWAVGVQWHPERTQGDPAMRQLFRAFVERAAAFRAARNK
jgi:putative glutamine amidotransferase